MSVLFTPSITLCASQVAQLVQLIKINEKKKSTCNVGDPDWIPGSGRSAGEGIGYTHQYSWASLVAQMVKNPPAMWETGFNPWVGKVPWRRKRLPIVIFRHGEFHGQRILAGYSPWGLKELEMTVQFYYFPDETTTKYIIWQDLFLLNSLTP